jgi:transcriptional regulator GlxA family with amidase domain
VLVHWRGEQASSATWEDLDDFRSRFPDFQLEDELDLEGGEMSCADAPTPGAGAPATCAGQKSALYARAVRRANWFVLDR